MPDVSVIVPAYVASDEQFNWLAEAANSVLHQSFTSWEMIIVDDASPVALEGNAQGQVRVLKHDRRRGAGAARNTGIAAATGEYILCLDADDRLKPNGLQTLWDARCPVGVVYGDLEYFGDRAGVHTLPPWSLEILLRGTSPLPITSLHRREAWRLAGGFDERLPGMEDVDYWIKLAQVGVCGYHVDGIIFEYRRHTASRQAGLEANNRERMRACVEIIQSRHRKVAGQMAAVQGNCSKCPGRGGQGTGIVSELPPEVGPNTVRLRYVGPMQGSFRAHGFATGARYYIDGRGDTIVVDVRDMPGLLQRATGGRPDFEQIPDVPPSYGAPVSPAAQASIENPPPALAQITDLNVKEATELIESTSDLSDLAVWLAEERAQEKPRKSVVAVLEARIEELQSAG